MADKLPLSFYLRENVVEIAKDLLGKFLFTNIDGLLTGGIITETEAYEGITDKASHAYNSRFTKRTETMYKTGGISYIYFTYGMHHLFNIVTNKEGIPHAVLVRAVFPTEGEEIMLKRTGKTKNGYNLTNGPAKLCKAMGITLKQNNISLLGDIIWLEDRGIKISQKDIEITPRIGIN